MSLMFIYLCMYGSYSPFPGVSGKGVVGTFKGRAWRMGSNQLRDSWSPSENDRKYSLRASWGPGTQDSELSKAVPFCLGGHAVWWGDDGTVSLLSTKRDVTGLKNRGTSFRLGVRWRILRARDRELRSQGQMPLARRSSLLGLPWQGSREGVA